MLNNLSGQYIAKTTTFTLSKIEKQIIKSFTYRLMVVDLADLWDGQLKEHLQRAVTYNQYYGQIRNLSSRI